MDKHRKKLFKDYTKNVFAGVFGGIMVFFLIEGVNNIRTLNYSFISIVLFSVVAVSLALITYVIGFFFYNYFDKK